MRNVKCQICKTLVPIDKAYKVSTGKVNKYYCSEAEYNSLHEQRAYKNKCFDLCFEILKLIGCHSVLTKHITMLTKTCKVDVLYSYLNNNKDDLSNIIRQKNIEKEYNRIRYLFAIIENNIGHYIPRDDTPIIQTNIEIYDTPKRVTNKNKRRGLNCI